MRTYTVNTFDGSPATLWSDDTFTLHYGAGFDDECESTNEDLAAAVSQYSLREIAETGGDSNDRQKASAALRIAEEAIEFPVRCTACGSTCESADATRDEGYIYCPACVAAEEKAAEARVPLAQGAADTVDEAVEEEQMSAETIAPPKP